MKSPQIESVLLSWFSDIVTKYNNIEFRYEYNQKRNVYLVSYSAPNDILTSDDFCTDLLKFEDYLDDKFGIDAPLFTENSELFVLSDNAQYIHKAQHFPITPITTHHWEYNIVVHNDNISYKIQCLTPLAA